jgi:hypothetical protein
MATRPRVNFKEIKTSRRTVLSLIEPPPLRQAAGALAAIKGSRKFAIESANGF